jgi:hypothetical protein
MKNADNRFEQIQAVRVVTYTDGAKKSFTSADSGQSGAFMAFSYDLDTSRWGVRSIGDRYYPTDKYHLDVVYVNDAAGEQEIVCAVAKPKPTATFVPVPTATAVPYNNPPRGGGNPPQNPPRENTPVVNEQKGPDPFNNGQNDGSDMVNRTDRGTGGGASNADSPVQATSLSQTGSNEH